MKRTVLVFIGMFMLLVGNSQTDSAFFDFNSMMMAQDANFYNIKSMADSFYSNHQSDGEEGGQYSRYLQWNWFWQHRVSSLDSSMNGSFKNYQNALLNFVQYPYCNGSYPIYNPWTILGPQEISYGDGNLMGRISAIASVPNNPNIVYVGSPTGGLFVTMNFNDNNPVWNNLTDNVRLPGLGINDIAVAPNNTSILYIATGIYDFGTSGFGVYGSGYGSGILKSTNGGLTWTQQNPLGLTETDVAYRVKINPQYSNIVYALISDKCFKSTNGGVNWQLSKQLPASIGLNGCAPGAKSRFWREIQFKPDDPNTIYCSTDDAPCGVVYQTNGNGGAQLWKSQDAGSTWHEVAVAPAGSGGHIVLIYVLLYRKTHQILFGWHINRS